MPFERLSMAGQPYRPSNGTEGDIFMARYCQRCRRHAHDCDILLAAYAYDSDDPAYPREWKYNNVGVPMCSAFSDIDGEPPPAPRCTETLDMFGGSR